MRVVIADDHAIMRDGVGSLVGQLDGFRVVGEASDGSELVELCETLRPEIAIVDLGMPRMNGIEAVRRIAEVSPGTRCVVLTMHSEHRYVTRALEAGVRAYVLKDEAFEELERALRTVQGGSVHLSAAVQAVVVSEYSGRAVGADARPEPSLSPREREVLQLVVEGRTAKQIAQDLCLSVKTVETHRRHICEKTGSEGVADLVRYAVREGIATLEH